MWTLFSPLFFVDSFMVFSDSRVCVFSSFSMDHSDLWFDWIRVAFFFIGILL